MDLGFRVSTRREKRNIFFHDDVGMMFRYSLLTPGSQRFGSRAPRFQGFRLYVRVLVLDFMVLRLWV